MVRTSFILYRDSIPPRRPFICSTFAKNVKKGTLKNVSNMEDATSQFHDQDLLQICGFLEIIGVTKFYSNAITFKALMSNSCNKVIKPQKFNFQKSSFFSETRSLFKNQVISLLYPYGTLTVYRRFEKMMSSF